MRRWQLQLLVVGVLFCSAALHAYHEALSKHTGVEFPAGRGFAVCAELTLSAIFAYTVFATLKSGRVTIGRGGGITFDRSENPGGFYLALVGIVIVSLFIFYQGVWSMFAT